METSLVNVAQVDTEAKEVASGRDKRPDNTRGREFHTFLQFETVRLVLMSRQSQR